MFVRVGSAMLMALVLSGCATTMPFSSSTSDAPAASLEAPTRTTPTLRDLPPPSRPVDVAVYDFPDLTGQAKPNPDFAEYSRAVTQGGASILVDVLTSVGNGSWFRVTERSGLKNLVQERTLIENTNRSYHTGAPPLMPVRFAGIIIEGGIVGYDSDRVTGGAGAKFFGIGGDVQYRSDVVTVNLRAVSVETGEILASVTTAKDIYSYENKAGSYVFTSPDHLLELEAGYSKNDPGQLAVREALELGVYSLIIEGLKSHQWTLADPSKAADLIASYDAEYEGVTPSAPSNLPAPAATQKPSFQ